MFWLEADHRKRAEEKFATEPLFRLNIHYGTEMKTSSPLV